MNSVLQCLSNTRSVLEYVISNEYTNHINTSTSSMNGALIKGIAFDCVTHVRDLNCFFLVFPPQKNQLSLLSWPSYGRRMKMKTIRTRLALLIQQL